MSLPFLRIEHVRYLEFKLQFIQVRTIPKFTLTCHKIFIYLRKYHKNTFITIYKILNRVVLLRVKSNSDYNIK